MRAGRFCIVPVRVPSGVGGPAGLSAVAERIATIQSLTAATRLRSASATSATPAAATSDASFAQLLSGQSVADDAPTESPLTGLDPLAALTLARQPAAVTAPSISAALAGYLANAPATTSGFTLRMVRPDQLPAVGITDAMRTAGNGNLPDGMLTALGDGDHRLSSSAAAAYRQLAADARRDGVTIGVNDSYRSYADQVTTANRLGLYGQGGLAAVPGTSNHGWGVALDLSLDDRAQQWMRDNAWHYSFFEDVQDEPWHWTYRG